MSHFQVLYTLVCMFASYIEDQCSTLHSPVLLVALQISLHMDHESWSRSALLCPGGIPRQFYFPCCFSFISLLTTAKHLGIFISLAEFRELLSYQGILADISVQFQDIRFLLFLISALNLLVCFVLLENCRETTALGHLVYTSCAASWIVY